MSDARRIKELLRGRVEELASYLFPNGRREGAHWCVGDITGSRGTSFKICLIGEKAGLWGDFADSQKHSRSLLDLWMQARNVDFKTALHEAAEWAGESLNGSNGVFRKLESAERNNQAKSVFNWNRCVAAFTEKHLEHLADWRGLSGAFCSWLHRGGLVGLHKGRIASPIHDSAAAVAAHYRLTDGSWRVFPSGTKMRPLVIGDLSNANVVHAFESQWDAFAVADKLALHQKEEAMLIITRGAGNGALVSGLIPPQAIVYAWPQNDEADKSGQRAGDEWLKAIVAHAGANVRVVTTPEQFKDANEWTKAGATVDELKKALGLAQVAPGAKAGEIEAEPDRDEKKPRKSAATELVTLAEKFAFFHDGQNRAFVQLQRDAHEEIWPVMSAEFRNLLAATYYKTKRKTANRNALVDAIATLQGKAQFDGPEIAVFLRVAQDGENILIDLCDAQWRVVEVTPIGWRILDKSQVAFVRTRAMRPLPLPARGGSLAKLWELLNIAPAQRPLVAGALLNYFHPSGPYFVTNLVGEQGTAKSCCARILRQLVDPSETPLRSPPREDRDLLVQAGSNWIVALDNLSSLPAWLSDAFCRLATGGGHSARSLFTDMEEVSLAIKRPVLLNGIEDVASRPDLAERALQVELETIPDKSRKSEKEVWLKFEAARPAIFGAILDGLVCALRELPNVRMDALPRMADAVLWATAGETALGFANGDFMRAYRRNLDESALSSVEAHPVGVVLLRMLSAENSEWTGEPAELLDALNKAATEEEKHPKNWPQNARALGHALRRLAQALRRAGVVYEHGRGKRRSIRLCKECKARKTTTPTTPTLPRHGDDGVDVDILSRPLHGLKETVF